MFPINTTSHNNFAHHIRNSPATALLSQSNTPNSVRTKMSILFRLIEIIDPPGLSKLIVELETHGFNRFHVVYFFPWENLTYSDVAKVRAKLVAEYIPTRANSMLCVLRCILKECWLTGSLELDQYEKLVAVKGIKLQKQTTSCIVPDNELKALFTVFRNRGVIGLRDATLLTLMCLGLSPGEVSQLNVLDYDPKSETIQIVPGNTRYHSRARTIYLDTKVKCLMDRWLEYRGIQDGPMFPQMVVSQHMHGKIVTGYPRLSVHGIYCIFALHEEKHGLAHHRLTDYRKTFIAKLFDHHIDELTISKIAGINSPDYIRIYNTLPENTKRLAASEVFQHHIV